MQKSCRLSARYLHFLEQLQGADVVGPQLGDVTLGGGDVSGVCANHVTARRSGLV